MPASFAVSLCGYRPGNGEPNTSDNSDGLSKLLGRALFEEMGVLPGSQVGADPGNAMEAAIQADLQPLRPDLQIIRSRAVTDFDQYQHLGVFARYRKGYEPASLRLQRVIEAASLLAPSNQVTRLHALLNSAADSYATQDDLASQLLANMPEESFLKVDLTVGQAIGAASSVMHIGLSSKWSLRTDRAQDCISQGSKLASQRRGTMPHFGVVTMEPRPAMLKILADGSGAIDCVYHLDLPALERAMSRLRAENGDRWSPAVTFDRLVKQRRLRDYSELVRVVQLIPQGEEATPTTIAEESHS